LALTSAGKTLENTCHPIEAHIPVKQAEKHGVRTPRSNNERTSKQGGFARAGGPGPGPIGNECILIDKDSLGPGPYGAPGLGWAGLGPAQLLSFGPPQVLTWAKSRPYSPLPSPLAANDAM